LALSCGLSRTLRHARFMRGSASVTGRMAVSLVQRTVTPRVTIGSEGKPGGRGRRSGLWNEGKGTGPAGHGGCVGQTRTPQ
jgi:hypothetical protein